MTDGPEDPPFFVKPQDSSPPPLRVDVSDESLVQDFVTAWQPLIQVGGSAIYPTSDPSPPVVIQPKPGSAVPDVGLSQNAWDLTTTGFGITVGGVVGHIPGAVIGGVVGFAWGRVRWIQVHRKRNDS